MKDDNIIKKILSVCLLLTSLIGYLEWGKGNHNFLFQVEYSLFFSSIGTSESFLHPFILIPLIGQLILLFTVFQKMPSRILGIVGLVCLSLIMLFLFFIGLFASNIKIAISAVPFIITGIIFLRYNRKQNKKA